MGVSRDLGASLSANGLGSAEAPEPCGLGPTGAIPSAIKPCPFCGSVSSYHKTFTDERDWGWVGCCNCGAQSGHGTQADVTAEWNARAETPKLPFDGAWWMDLLCSVANARYALEQWDREYAVAARHVPRLSVIQGCVQRGRSECETLRDMEEAIRSIVCPASAIEARRAATGNTDAVHESAASEAGDAR